jgi:hypothetical protein
MPGTRPYLNAEAASLSRWLSRTGSLHGNHSPLDRVGFRQLAKHADRRTDRGSATRRCAARESARAMA